eukprot:NODE_498_length_7675_cov_0.481389.p6 type:complete len:185 gc:universal NODE_498_length_7675_cov_0.481389:6086-5532(-)
MCDCDHAEPSFAPNSHENLLKYIDVANCQYLNALNEARIFEEENQSPLLSDLDDTLIVQIPFSVPVKLFEIKLRFSNEQSKHLLLFKNKVIDFEDEDESDMIIPQYKSLEQHYPIKSSMFSSVTLLQLYFKDNWNGNDHLELIYVEIRGQSLQVIKDPIIAIYEKAANPKDHPQTIKNLNSMGY